MAISEIVPAARRGVFCAPWFSKIQYIGASWLSIFRVRRATGGGASRFIFCLPDDVHAPQSEPYARCLSGASTTRRYYARHTGNFGRTGLALRDPAGLVVR